MVIVLLGLVSDSSKSSSNDGDSVMGKLKRTLLEIVRRRRPHVHADAECSECEKRQDESLHELATRLHVLEWEARLYETEGARRKRKKP